MPATGCPFSLAAPTRETVRLLGAGAGNAPRQGRRAQGFVSYSAPAARSGRARGGGCSLRGLCALTVKGHAGGAHTLFLTLLCGDVCHKNPPRTPSPIPKDHH